MGHIVIMWTLLMMSIYAASSQSANDFEYPRCRSWKNCVENDSASPEKFYYEVNGYEIIIDYRDVEHFVLWCCNNFGIKDSVPVNIPDLPVMSRLVAVEKVIIQCCTVPSKGSYAEALKAMNITAKSRLILNELPTNQKLERHHLRGLEISELEITANDSTNPPRPEYDYLEDLFKLRTLKLKSVVLEPEALMLLPVTLEYLNLEHAGLPTAERTLSNGGAWLERLHSLKFLDLVESSESATKTPGFIILPKLVSLPKLTNLSLHFVPLNSSSLADSLKDSSIEDLVLVSCGLNNLPDTLFEGVNLTRLVLTYNNLTVSDGVFSPLQWLTNLDLSDNEMSGAALVRMLAPLAHARLKTLMANDNPLGSLCGNPESGSVNSESGLPKTLSWLELRGTSATHICSDWIKSDALMHIDLTNNSIGNLTYNELKMTRAGKEMVTGPVRLNLSENPKLRMINISGTNVLQCHNDSLQFSDDSNIRTKARVKLKLDSLTCDCSGYWLREALHNCLLYLENDVPCVPEPHVPAKTTLLGYDFNDIHCPYNDFCLPECSCWKRPRDNATVVRCEEVVPLEPQWPPSAHGWPLALHVASGTLSAVPRTTLVELRAPNNNIASLEEMVIDESLLMLDVRNNSIEHISEAVAKKLSAVRANRSVFLAGNQFACTCSDAPAFELLSQVARDWNITQCADNSYVSEKSESDLCSYSLVPALLGLITLTLVLLTVGLLLLKFKSQVRKFQFRYNLCLRCILTPKDSANDSDKTHDVFLSYANDDHERLTELRCGLENRGYSTIEHSRDWQPGESISVQISRSVLCARRTLLLVSDNYAKSKWALEEFYAAHMHAMERRTTRVLIVRYNLTEPEKLPLELQLYLKYNTYLDWNDDHFWYKLCQVMPPLCFETDDQPESG